MKIIDTHLHIWNLKELSLPWLSGEGPVLMLPPRSGGIWRVGEAEPAQM